MKFRRLKKGERVGVFGPGGPVRPDRWEAGVKTLEQLGFEVTAPLDPCKYYGDYSHGFSNGSVKERVAALNALLDDEGVGLILASRGAFGTIEMLPSIDFKKIAAAGKTFVGYSDTTNLLAPWVRQAGVCAIHGSTLSKEFAEYHESDSSKQSVDQLLSLVMEESYEFTEDCIVLREGSGSGELLAGNLTVLESLIGTPWEPDYDGKVLVLEDIGEKPYRSYRALLHLHHAGKLDGLAGLVFGRFDQCTAPHGPSIEEVFETVLGGPLAKTSYPVVSGLPFGHNGLNYALPLGLSASVEANRFSYST